MNSKVSAAAMVFFLPSRVLRFLGLLAVSSAGLVAIRAAPASASAPVDVPVMLQSFLDREAHRLDAQFLAGITNRAGWEAQRAERYRQYMEMLGLWPLPERTPLHAQVTGVLERSEGFRVEKLHFQSRPHLYVTANLYLPKDARAGAKLPGVLVDPPASHRAGPIFPNVLRVTDIPEALSWLAPRPLVLHTADANAFALTADVYRLLGASLDSRSWP